MSKETRGILYVLIAAVLFGFMPIWVKQANAAGMGTLEICFIRSLIAGVIMFIVLLLRRQSLRLQAKQLKWLTLAGLLVYAPTLLSLYAAYLYLPAGVATSLHYLFPVLVMLLSWLVLGRQLRRLQWLAVFMSLVGIWCMSGSSSGGSWIGVGLALASALLFAVYILMIDNPALKEVSSMVIIFYVCMFTAAFFFIVLLARGQWPVVFNPVGWLYCCLVAILCAAVAMILFIIGVKSIGPDNTAILSTLEPVVSIVAGIVILGEILTPTIIIGCLLVLGAVFIISIREQASARH